MADWRSSLKKGTYEVAGPYGPLSVPFHLDISELSGGRRSYVTQFPGRKFPSVEDLGPEMNHFQLDIFVVGPTWMAGRIALEIALSQPGPGTLTHPYRGKLTVRPGKFKTRETVAEQAYARITCEFWVVDKAPINIPVIDPIVSTNVAADAVEAAVQNDFKKKFSVSGPIALLSLAKQSLTNALDKVAQLSNSLASVTNTPASMIVGIEQQLTSLVLTPANLGLQVMSAIHTITSASFNPLAALNAQLAILASVISPASSGSTNVAVQADANSAAFTALVQTVAFCECCRLVSGEMIYGGVDTNTPGVTFTTREQALAVHATLLAQADLLMDAVGDETLVPLMQLVTTTVATFAAVMPITTVNSVTLPGGVPDVVLAQQLYGDCLLADDISERNGVAHPMYLPAGVPLEVLSD